MLGLGNSITSGGYTPFTLTSVSSLALWLQNGVGVSAAQWNDSSGNNNHIAQTNVDKRATVSGGGLDFEEGEFDFYNIDNSIAIADEGGFCIAWVIILVRRPVQPIDIEQPCLSMPTPHLSANSVLHRRSRRVPWSTSARSGNDLSVWR